MDSFGRCGLEESFEPHNRRPYNYLGVDLGWKSYLHPLRSLRTLVNKRMGG